MSLRWANTYANFLMTHGSILLESLAGVELKRFGALCVSVCVFLYVLVIIDGDRRGLLQGKAADAENCSLLS